MYSGQDAHLDRAAAARPEEERKHHVEDKARRLKSLRPNSLVELLQKSQKMQFPGSFMSYFQVSFETEKSC